MAEAFVVDAFFVAALVVAALVVAAFGGDVFAAAFVAVFVAGAFFSAALVAVRAVVDEAFFATAVFVDAEAFVAGDAFLAAATFVVVAAFVPFDSEAFVAALFDAFVAGAFVVAAVVPDPALAPEEARVPAMVSSLVNEGRARQGSTACREDKPSPTAPQRKTRDGLQWFVDGIRARWDDEGHPAEPGALRRSEASVTRHWLCLAASSASASTAVWSSSLSWPSM